MLQFQPPGFGQRAIATSLGVVAYYTAVASPWCNQAIAASTRPTLLFLHSLGGGSSAYEWSKLYPAFAADFRIVAPDLIGWGQSTHLAKDYRAADYLTLIAELIEALGSPPAAVFASSLTAGLLVRLAVQRPELFRQLILICPSGYSDFGVDYRQGISAQLARLPRLDQLIYRLGAANELAVRSVLQQFLFANPGRVTPEMVSAFLCSAQQLNADYAALASLRGDLCFDLARYIPQLTVPTVVVWGEKARFSTLATGERLARLNPTAIKAFHLVPDAGVLPHLEVPEAVVSLLTADLF